MGALAQLKYHYFHRLFSYAVKLSPNFAVRPSGFTPGDSRSCGNQLGGQGQAGCLTGAVHLSKGNAGVLR